MSAKACSQPLLRLRRGSATLIFRLESAADAEHVAIRMSKVNLANVPRHIGGRKCDLQPGGDAMLVHLIHVVHPHRHPDALVALFVALLLKRGGVGAAAAASLRPLTKKDASFLTRSNRAKRRWSSPVPQFLPSPIRKPRERAGDVRHIQYRSQAFGFHNRSRITPEVQGIWSMLAKLSTAFINSDRRFPMSDNAWFQQ